MPVSVGAPRQLLRRLREVMAERESAQVRLDKVVVLIASNMVAEVCSLYLRRRDGSLELFATEGLNPEAVHNTHLKPGEGLVGLIAEQAEPLQFPDAQHHPAFSYRPETGEEIYHSFVGVPILRGGHTIGVLTVQNRTKRQYSDEEIEALQTTAMVLAEMIASGGLVTDEVSAETRRDLAARFERPSHFGRRGARPCGAARAAHRGHAPDRRGYRARAAPARPGHRGSDRHRSTT